MRKTRMYTDKMRNCIETIDKVNGDIRNIVINKCNRRFERKCDDGKFVAA